MKNILEELFSIVNQENATYNIISSIEIDKERANKRADCIVSNPKLNKFLSTIL